jgi:hypothetical protein
MGWLKGMLRGGDDELGWDDLVRRIVDAIGALRRYGAKGEIAFPDEVIVRITVGEGSVATIQSFVDRPDLDRAVGAALANKHDLAVSSLPARSYLVSAADRTTVTAAEGASKPWFLVLDGGATLSLPAGQTEFTFGRGSDCDVTVFENVNYVSRRAFRLFRTGNLLEVAALDQADELVVRRASGDTLRPARTSRGRVVLQLDDRIELGDGRGNHVTLTVKR